MRRGGVVFTTPPFCFDFISFFSVASLFSVDCSSYESTAAYKKKHELHTEIYVRRSGEQGKPRIFGIIFIAYPLGIAPALDMKKRVF